MNQHNQEKEEAMLKRFMLIGVLCFSVMMLLQTHVMAAYTVSGGTGFTSCYTKTNCTPTSSNNYCRCCSSFCYGCYGSGWIVKGGSNPNDIYGAIIDASGTVLSDALVCYNPGTGQRDVRKGLGGLTSINLGTKVSPLNTFNDANGNQVVFTDFVCSKVGETLPNDHICTVDDLAAFVGIGVSDLQSFCRNSNWAPLEYLILSVELSGILYNGCDLSCLTAGDKTFEDCIGTCTGNTKNANVYCETDASTRTVWGGDQPVNYICVNLGNPIAWNDSYSGRTGRTLTVSGPGVLGNDHDTGTDALPLTAVLDTNVSNGTLALNPDGGFTYTSNKGFIGADSFTYRAFDGVNYSNVATVTITVTK